ncbi:MAG: enoyl-CoA hydratase/isomerase family protein [Deltaproteobacteria bacterium]|nr:enoyl-CoA hydratase/isomerase family protein [Deltaproteobacteria bacterium]
MEKKNIIREWGRKDILYEKKGPMAFITFNRPDKINAMTEDMFEGLEEAIRDYTDDDDLSCIIITGAGGNFSSGEDLKEKGGHGKLYDGWGTWPCYRAMLHCPKPIIAAVDGYCIGSAFNCAVLYSDIRIASERAKFGLPQAEFQSRTGVRERSEISSESPRGKSYAMPYTHHLSLGNALYITLCLQQFGSDVALRMGLIQEVVPHEKLMERANELASMILKKHPRELRLDKELQRAFVEAPGFAQRLTELVRW